MLNKKVKPLLWAILALLCIAKPCAAAGASVLNSEGFNEKRVQKAHCLKLFQELAAKKRGALLASYGAKRDVANSWDKSFLTGKAIDDISKSTKKNLALGPSGMLMAAAGQMVPRRTAVQVARTEPANPGVYTVKHKVASGDSLSAIAARYSISVNTIMWSNSLSNPNKLKIGQVLEFPSVSGVIHKVGKGETIWTIAKRYGVSRDEIVRANALEQPDKLALKQALVIPGGKPLPSPKAPVQLASRGQASSRNDAVSYSGDTFGWPLSGRISSRYGLRWGRMHHGIDIAVSTGTSVRAASGGRVIFSGTKGGYGRLIIIDHGDGVHTYYAHNSKLLAGVGDRVEAGDRIALSGNTGTSTGPHLHFEIRINGKSVNPLNYLN